jgi:ribose transport system ATP-binding protein
MPPLLRMRGITKRFRGVTALQDVDLDLQAGEAHVLLGENGAGKSTLIKMLAGALEPDAGTIEIDGRRVTIHSAQQANALGVGTVFQEFTLVPGLTVAENVYLGRPPRRFGVVDHRRMRRDAEALLRRLGIALDVDTPVGRLGVARRQLVEIAKALSHDVRILILDEPTAVLAGHEIDQLFALVRELRASGVGIIFISHHLEEVARIGDRVTVLRDGRRVGELPADASQDELIQLMVGRPIDQQYPRRTTEFGTALLQVEGLGRDGVFADVSFEVRAGEVLGIGGLVGAGRTELVRAVFGADRRQHGTVRVAGRELPPGDPSAAEAVGLGLVPEDRAGQGLVLVLDVGENLGLATLGRSTRWGLVDRRGLRRRAADIVRRLRIRTTGLDQLVGNLSGGNQQKVVIGKWLLADLKVLILDEPTRGIDVGAKVEIYQLINDLTGAGNAVLMVSSEMPELLGMSDRILVMADGRVRGELTREEADSERVMALAVLGGADVHG